MATQTIHGYAAASAIDPIADYLLIDPASTGNYNKINRNVLLGITGSPVGTTDTQVLSNKTIGNTNSITLKDGNFNIQNSSDVTKQAIFSLAGITTGTTRTYTLPNATVTLASLTGTETLTNKILTSPTINGGTIDNTSVTVDSISGHTTPTVVTVGGVQMNNGTIGTSGAVTSTSIATGAVTPNSLIASSGSGWAWQNWTPTWTNLTVGNGTVEAKYTQIGKTIIGRAIVTFGTTTSVGGAVSFTMPVTAATSAASTGGLQIGSGTALIAGTIYGIFTYFISTTSIGVRTFNIAATYPVHTDLTAAIPGTWANTSILAVEFFYEVA